LKYIRGLFLKFLGQPYYCMSNLNYYSKFSQVFYSWSDIMCCFDFFVLKNIKYIIDANCILICNCIIHFQNQSFQIMIAYLYVLCMPYSYRLVTFSLPFISAYHTQYCYALIPTSWVIYGISWRVSPQW